MTHGLFEGFSQRKVWLFDGGMGSLLQKRGLPPGGCPDEYNLIEPEIVRSIHRAYVEAGSDIIQTNTFGANPIRLEMYGLAPRSKEINARAVVLARGAANDKAKVIGSMGPLGEMIEPLGEVTRAAAYDAFRIQARGLVEADAINIETAMSLDEVAIALEAVRSVTSLPICVSMTFNTTPKGQFTMMGESATDCVLALEKQDVNVIGANCGDGVEQVIEVLREMALSTDLPLLAKPNAGIPAITGGEEVYPEDATSFSKKMSRVVSAGAAIIGGCCGTTPDHIRNLRFLADEINAAA